MTGPLPDGSIVVTGRGMATSLGGAVSACAAARAGLALPAPLGVRMRSPEDGSVDEVKGHPAGELTRGFEGFARLLRLATLGLGDLLEQTKDGPWQLTRVGAYLSLPDPYRLHTGLDCIADEETRAARSRAAREARSEGRPDVSAKLLDAAAQLAGWTGAPALRFCATSGHTGFAEAVQRAVEDLQHGRVSAAVVGGVDSLVEEETVMWLHGTGRLKRLGVPVGLLPGEASAFVLLETARAARGRGARPLAAVHAACFEDEEAPLLSGAPARAGGLSRVLAGIAGAAGFAGAGPVWVVSDCNGENYRAAEWGLALSRLAGRFPALASPVVWYPAMSFGDVGAASGAVSLCLAVHAFLRGGAPAPAVTLVSSADGARRAALHARAAPARDPESPA
jgi:3-oxoacyl-[acyl-carrier-protein] synthase-1